MDKTRQVQCKMCGRTGVHMAQSHIVPRSFFRFGETRTQRVVNSFQKDGDGRRLPWGIYDETILCSECENRLNPFDLEGANCFNQLVGATTRHRRPSEELYYFENVKRLHLRGFVATLLWRMSVTRQKEFAVISIGKHYEQRIATDVLNGGTFSYIDAVVAFWPDPLAWAAETPEPVRFKENGANGYCIKLPKVLILASLDQRPIPGETRFPTFENPNEEVSPSLRSSDDDLPFVILKHPVACGNLVELASIYRGYTINHKRFAKDSRKTYSTK